MPAQTLIVRRLGLQPYQPVWEAMRDFTETREPDTEDEIWLLQHPPVFTQGLNGKAENVLAPDDIPVIHIDRGGQVTYHGPGQLVAYTLIDLRRTKRGVKELVTQLERAVIRVLTDYHVSGESRSNAPGVYVNGAKIASLGLRIRRGASYHGLSFNIDMDLTPFQRIHPCGLKDIPVTQLRTLAPSADIRVVEAQLIDALGHELGYRSIRDAPEGEIAAAAHQPTL